MFGWITRSRNGKQRRVPPDFARAGLRPGASRLLGKFDSAQTNADNRRHWANADGLSAAAAASPQIRQILRNRARYEVANNSYARGIVLTLANDVIGTGPRLQMLTENEEVNRKVEAQFAAWAKAVDLPGKLRTMRMARAQDGEAFAMLFSNDALAGAVKMDLRLIEADQVATPMPAAAKPGAADGIVFDEFGNPVEYHVLKSHPGGSGALTNAKFDEVRAADMIHWFRTDRPGQIRGLPDIMPALPLFAQLRAYTLAVVAAAKTAAHISVVMKTNTPAGGEAADVEPMTTMDFEPNMAVFTPEGWEPFQIKAEQPATTYEMFKREIINEIARCLNMPYNVAACNSSAYNYASGRLDHQTYFKSIRVDQAHCETVILDRVLTAWLAEATMGGTSLGDGKPVPHQWFWDGHEHVDPLKEAKAQDTRLANHSTTYAAEYARQGKDYETELRQKAKEVALLGELGLTMPKAGAPAAEDAETEASDLIEEMENATK